MRPGVNVLSRDSVPARGAPTETGTAFFAGLAAKGPTDEPVLVRNMRDYDRHFGGRVSYGLLYDALDFAFQEGLTKAYVTRVVGPAAAVDTVTLADAGLADSIAVDSIGEYDSDLTVAVVAGGAADTFRLEVRDDGVLVETSPDLADPTAAATWSSGSDYVRVRALGANDPAVAAATALAGGTDDRAAITDVEREAALALFGRGLGPGQVAYPGATTGTIHTALIEHAVSHNRTALLDAPDTNVVGTLTGAAQAQTDIAGFDEEYGALFAPWLTVPGVVRGTTRTVPPSAGVAGLIARSDGAGNANVPAAGANGEFRYALGLSQGGFTDEDRETLNENGVNVIRTVYGGQRLYGYRTLADVDDNPNWVSLGNQRLRMQITAEADAIGEAFAFAQIDGRGVKISEFGGALTGMLARFYSSGALYGETAGDAFTVNVGPAVNTPETIANGELRAVLGVKMSPFAEEVTIEIVKVGITESL